MLNEIDKGISQTNAIAVSKFVNGNVSIQNLNGLEIRLQSILFLRDVLFDLPSTSSTEMLSFSWRRNSEKELTGELDSQGHPKRKFILRSSPWVIDAPLDKQRP